MRDVGNETERSHMTTRFMQIIAAGVVLSLTTSCGSATSRDTTPQNALKVARAFRMKSSSESAHQQALSQGLKKSSSKRVDELRIVFYTGSAQVKLVFSPDNALTAVLVRITPYDKTAIASALRSLQTSLGTPSKVYGDWSDFLAGVNFDTCVYAEWPYFLLTHGINDESIWIERSWAK
jgi:hypothetical protein